MRFSLSQVFIAVTSFTLSINASNIEILLTSNIKPFIESSSPNKGPIVKRVKEVLNSIPNINYSIDYISDGNLLMHPPLLKHRKYDIGLRWNRPDCKFEEQKSLCDVIVSKPLLKTVSRFYRRKNSQDKIFQPKDIYGKKICRPMGWFGFDLEKHGFVNGENITMITPNTPTECFTKLKNGEVDFVTLTEYSANPIIKKLKLAKYIESVSKLSMPIEFSLIASKTNPKAHIYIHKLNVGLAKLDNIEEK